MKIRNSHLRRLAAALLCLLLALSLLAGCGKEKPNGNDSTTADSGRSDGTGTPAAPDETTPHGGEETEPHGGEETTPHDDGETEPHYDVQLDGKGGPATLAQLQQRFGNEAAARAVFALYSLPGFHYDLDVTQRYTEAFESFQLRFEELSGELQYGPFAMHTVFRYRNRAEEDPARRRTGDEYVSAFGSGELSALYCSSSHTMPGRDLEETTIKSSGQLLRQPEEAPHSAFFPGADYFNGLVYRAASDFEGSMSLPLSAQLHEQLTGILTGAVDYSETGRGEINGKNAVCYTGRYAGKALRLLCDYLYCPVGNVRDDEPLLAPGVEVRLWVDEATGLPLRVEADFTELEKNLLRDPDVFSRLVNNVLSRYSASQAEKDRVLAGDPEEFLRIGEISFRLDLEPRTEAIRIPGELPDESERVVLRWVTEAVEKVYGHAKRIDTYGCLGRRGWDPMSKVVLLANSFFSGMRDEGRSTGVKEVDGETYVIRTVNDWVSTISEAELEQVCRYGEVEEKIGKVVLLPSGCYAEGMDGRQQESLKAAFQEFFDKNQNPADTVSVEVRGETIIARKTRAKEYEVFRIVPNGFEAEQPLGAEFEAALAAAAEAGSESFQWNGADYLVVKNEEGTVWTAWWLDSEAEPEIFTTLNAILAEPGAADPETLRAAAVTALAEGETGFSTEAGSFTLAQTGESWQILDQAGNEFAALLPFRVIDYVGEDKYPLSFCREVIDQIKKMAEANQREDKAVMNVPVFPDDSEGSVSEMTIQPLEVTIEKQETGGYTIFAPLPRTSIKEVPAHGED